MAGMFTFWYISSIKSTKWWSCIHMNLYFDFYDNIIFSGNHRNLLVFKTQNIGYSILFAVEKPENLECFKEKERKVQNSPSYPFLQKKKGSNYGDILERYSVMAKSTFTQNTRFFPERGCNTPPHTHDFRQSCYRFVQ